MTKNRDLDRGGLWGSDGIFPCLLCVLIRLFYVFPCLVYAPEVITATVTMLSANKGSLFIPYGI